MGTEGARFAGSCLVTEGQYEPESRAMVLTFRDGTRRGYYGVPVAVWRGLTATSSVGGFFNRHIKDNYRSEPL